MVLENPVEEEVEDPKFTVWIILKVNIISLTEDTIKFLVEEINTAFKKAANSSLKGILEYTEDPIVSADIVGNVHSNIFDSLSTMANGKLVKVVGWYDNEYGYSCRVVDLMKKVA